MISTFSLKELSKNTEFKANTIYICFRRVTTVSGVGATMLGGRVPAFSHSLLKKKKLHHEKAIFPQTPFFDGITFLSTTINYQQFFPPFSFTPLSLRSPSLYEQAGPATEPTFPPLWDYFCRKRAWPLSVARTNRTNISYRILFISPTSYNLYKVTNAFQHSIQKLIKGIYIIHYRSLCLLPLGS